MNSAVDSSFSLSCVFGGVLAKLRNAAIGFGMSCPSVPSSAWNWPPFGRIFLKYDTCAFLQNLV
jgi:hypothetical protein